jgi:hypothetical protein
MSGAPFTSARQAVIAVLSSDADLNRKTGQFLGSVACQDEPMTERQAKWFADILKKAGLPPLDGGGA